MSILKFRSADVLRVCEHTEKATKHRLTYGETEPATPKLWLVGDRGVYLMSNGETTEDDRKAKPQPHVAYAEGINPEVDDFDDWWSEKRATFGGDDGCEALPWAIDAFRMIATHRPFVRIKITPTQLALLTD